MISFDRDGIRSLYWVAGLRAHGGYVLQTRADGDGYWILPGGWVETGEDTRAALGRELMEETGGEAGGEHLLWATENFFHLNGTDHHELLFTYALSSADPAILDNTHTHRTTDGDTRIELRWFDLDRPETVPFQPSFLEPRLKDPPETPQHLIAAEPQEKADRRKPRSGAKSGGEAVAC